MRIRIERKIKGLVPFILLCAVSVLFFCADSDADVINLKNGRRLEGAITSQTKDSVIIDIGVGEASVNRNDIKSIEADKENNAAIYYFRAIDLANYIKTGDAKKRMEEIENKGFSADAKEIEGILGANKLCLGEIEKGLAIKTCDFYFQDKYRFHSERMPFSVPSNIKALHLLLLLKGRLCESKNDYAGAIDSYLSALTFAQQLSQSSDSRFKEETLLVEKNTYPLIMGYLESKNPDKAICKRIADYLSEYDKKHFSAGTYMALCKELYLYGFKEDVTDSVRWFREHPEYDSEKRKKCEEVANETMKQAQQLADRYYGNLIKAAITDKDGDLKFATDDYLKLVAEAKPTIIEDEVDKDIFFAKISETDEYIKQDPRMLAVTIMTLFISADIEGLEIYRKNSNQLQRLRSLAAAK